MAFEKRSITVTISHTKGSKDLQQSKDAEARAFVREAERIELDRVLPPDAFTR